MCLTDMREIDFKDLVYLTEHELKRFERTFSKEQLIDSIRKRGVLKTTENEELLKLKAVCNKIFETNKYMSRTSKRKLVNAIKDHYLNVGIKE